MAEVSGRYARALFAAAKDEGRPDSIARYEGLLGSFHDAIRNSPEFWRFLVGPHVSRERKKALLGELIADRDDVEFLNFLMVLVDKDRLSSLPAIDEAFHRLRLAGESVIEATVESAFPLDQPTVDRIRVAFMKKMGVNDFKVTVRVAPELIGGLRVIIGSSVYDGTARSELDRMHGILAK
jgi:F-type H+-transporting ATPase subunit delta